MSFLRRMAGRILRDSVRSSVTWEELRVELLLFHVERSQLRWLGHLFWMFCTSLGRCSGHAPLGKTKDTLEEVTGARKVRCLCSAETVAPLTRLRISRYKPCKQIYVRILGLHD